MKIKCPTPHTACNGGNYLTTSGLGKTIRLHNSRKEAYQCYVRYLLSQGYTRIDNMPDCLLEPKEKGGYVLVLGKLSQFGAAFRMGKNQDGSGKRYMPKQRTGGSVI